jgi:predicted aldo/keto reductase-like oxidoreductase
MHYRRFGRTELKMPVFSCGGMRYQYQWEDMAENQIPHHNQQNLETTIKRSLEVGINHIETARGYGTSEMQLGRILPKLERKKLIIQTKVSPKPNPQEFRQEFEKSLAYLNLEYVDLLGLHGINTPELLDYSIAPNGCLEEAKKLQQEGKVRYIGFSTHGSTEIIINTIQTGQFDYVNLHWYWINQLNWQAIEAATVQDMGVFIISPSDKGGMLYKPPEKLVKLCDPLTPIVFNNLFCLSHPQVHTLSIGAAKPRDFDEHLKTLNYLNYSSKKIKEILTKTINNLENEAIKILGEDWFKNWQNGLPSYENIPNNINIQVILWLRNLALAYDMVEYGKMRYNLLGNGGHWFPGQKADEVSNFNLNECLKNSPFRDKIPQLLTEADQLLGGEEVKRLSNT